MTEWTRDKTTLCSTFVAHRAFVFVARVVGVVYVCAQGMDKIRVEEETWTRLGGFTNSPSVI